MFVAASAQNTQHTKPVVPSSLVRFLHGEAVHGLVMQRSDCTALKLSLKTHQALEIQSRELGSYAFTHFLDKAEGLMVTMVTPVKMLLLAG